MADAKDSKSFPRKGVPVQVGPPVLLEPFLSYCKMEATSTMPVADFLNVQEVADLLGCTDARVRQMLIAGAMLGVKANARAWMVPRQEATRVAKQERRKGGRRRIGDDD
jgi:hypothetical protein